MYKYTNTRFLNQLFAGISASLGAFCAATLFGWITPILPNLLSDKSEIPMTLQEASWMISAPEFANLITPIPAGILVDHFGRKPMILLSAPLFTLGWLIILIFKTYSSIIIARSIQGASVGIVFTAVPVYLGEIASVEHRGAISSLFFIFSWSGYLFEYCTGPFMSFTNFTLLTLATSVLYFLLMCFQPESPYFCLMKGDKEKARSALKWFRNSCDISLNIELAEMQRTVKEEQETKVQWNEVLKNDLDRKALYLLIFASSLRILSGTMPIVSYATNNFTITSNTFIKPAYITIILGMVLVFGACCSFFTLDYFGRRPLIIFSAIGSSIFLFVTGSYYFLDAKTSIDVSAYSWTAPFSTLLYAAIDVAGLYPVASAYTSELFTSRTRSTAAGISAVFSTLFTFLTIKLYQNFIDMFGVYLNFYLFSMICIIGAFFSYFILPETKNKTFEQIRLEMKK